MFLNSQFFSPPLCLFHAVFRISWTLAPSSGLVSSEREISHSVFFPEDPSLAARVICQTRKRNPRVIYYCHDWRLFHGLKPCVFWTRYVIFFPLFLYPFSSRLLFLFSLFFACCALPYSLYLANEFKDTPRELSRARIPGAERESMFSMWMVAKIDSRSHTRGMAMVAFALSKEIHVRSFQKLQRTTKLFCYIYAR